MDTYSTVDQVHASVVNNITVSNCVVCRKDIPRNQVAYTDEDLWLCSYCLVDIFPYNHISNNDDFLGSIREESNHHNIAINKNLGKKLNIFPEELGNRLLINNNELDPDNNLFADLAWDSPYTTPAAVLRPASTPLFYVMHLNCRSIAHKIPEINELLGYIPVSVLALTETWLNNELADTINIPHYQLIHKAKQSGRCGGVGLLIKQDITYQNYDTAALGPEPKTYECIFARIPLTAGNGSCLVGAIYRSPGTNLEEFCVEMDLLMSKIEMKEKHIILMGDFNIDLLRVEDHSGTHSFFSNMTAHNLLPSILRPTRITEHSATLIDNIFTNAWPEIEEAKIVTSDISDHLPVFTSFNFNAQKYRNYETNERRLINEETKGLFNTSLSAINWTAVSEACFNGDVNKAYELFITHYKDAYTRAFPIIVEKNKPRFKQPWMTKGLLKSSKKKPSYI